MIHELRIYRCCPGRLPDLNKLKARAESECGGPIVANIACSILAPTAYSKLR
jgi:hypothetical protein